MTFRMQGQGPEMCLGVLKRRRSRFLMAQSLACRSWRAG